MNVVILVPWRPTPDREGPWEHGRSHLEELGFPIFTADSDGPVFSMAQAFNRAADRPWDKAILSEADVWCPVDQIRAALELGGLVYCYDRHVRLSRPETDRFLEAGVMPDRAAAPAESKLGSNGVRVIDRDLWDLVGGYDERFVGWGAEDNDFLWRCVDAGGPVNRVAGPMFELAHEHEPVYRSGYRANRKLLAQKHPARYP